MSDGMTTILDRFAIHGKPGAADPWRHGTGPQSGDMYKVHARIGGQPHTATVIDGALWPAPRRAVPPARNKVPERHLERAALKQHRGAIGLDARRR